MQAKTLHHKTQYISSVGQTFITRWYIYNVAFVLFWIFVVHSFCACNKFVDFLRYVSN